MLELYSYMHECGVTLAQAWPVCIGLFVLIIAMAWLSLRFYDEPLRRRLSAKLLH